MEMDRQLEVSGNQRPSERSRADLPEQPGIRRHGTRCNPGLECPAIQYLLLTSVVSLAGHDTRRITCREGPEIRFILKLIGFGWLEKNRNPAPDKKSGTGWQRPGTSDPSKSGRGQLLEESGIQ